MHFTWKLQSLTHDIPSQVYRIKPKDPFVYMRYMKRNDLLQYSVIISGHECWGKTMLLTRILRIDMYL